MLPDPIFLNIHMYGVMMAIGIACCFGVLFLYGKKIKTDPAFLDFMFYDGIASVVFGIGSAILFQSVYNYIEDPAGGFHIKNSGMTFIGGLIGGVVFFLIVYFIARRKLTARLIDALPIVPCCITIAHAFGRIGCFFAGCCYGKATDSFLGVKFPGLSHAVHPTQLYEALFLFILFGVLSYLLLKKRFKYNMSLYLVAYGVFRFLIEFLRGDDRGKLLGALSPSQFWSILMIIGGIVLFVFTRKHYKSKASENCAEAENAQSDE
ncbi:MAG: prolipoprotein diacylglyceryl transferase [Eubacteriales bacterium]